MTGTDGRLIAIDLSNLCRDQRLPEPAADADATTDFSTETGADDFRTEIDQVDRFLDGARRAGIDIGEVRLVADRSLPHHLDDADRRRLRELEHYGVLEYSSIADERLLELAFGVDERPDTLIASMDWFDDFRRTFPAIQGSTDRFLGWEPDDHAGVRVFFRDMGVHTHRRISRKEESAEFKARRLQRESVVRRATSYEYRCTSTGCLLAQLWPDRLPELPRYDDRGDRFVCPSCGSSLTAGDERPRSIEVIVQLHGVEQFRLVLNEGERLVVGRHDGEGRVGLTPRLNAPAIDAVSREHLSLEYDGWAVRVQDLGSRNGTLLRDPSGRERRLQPDEPQVFGPRATIVLPSGITCELSGRSMPRPGEPESADSDQSDEFDGRMTRILATKR